MGAVENQAGRPKLKLVLHLVSLLGLALTGYGLWLLWSNLFTKDPHGYYYSPHRWYVIILFIVVGLLTMLLSSFFKFDQFEDIVGTAKVIGHEYSSSLAGDTYYLVLEGNNRVGTTIKQSFSVQPKVYYDYEEGDIYEKPS